MAGDTKVTYLLKIEGLFSQSGDYYGTNETLDWFVEHAEDDTRNMKVLIQRGAAEPQQLANVKISVDRVILEPRKL